MTHARRAIDEGRSLVIFPEGRRTAPGERIAYQRGVAGLYSALDVPVVPVALNCGLFWASEARQEEARAGGHRVSRSDITCSAAAQIHE